jgi:hypothetical protein
MFGTDGGFSRTLIYHSTVQVVVSMFLVKKIYDTFSLEDSVLLVHQEGDVRLPTQTSERAGRVRACVRVTRAVLYRRSELHEISS